MFSPKTLRTKGDEMYENISCGECGGEVEEFMLETYEMFIEHAEDLEEYLCSSCLHEVSGDG